MKKFLQIFIVPKDGKISDKTLTYNIVAGVLGILLCLTSLTAATWAWFGSSITTQSNSIKSGQYDVSVSVVERSDAETETALTADENDNYKLEAGKTYSIGLEGLGNVSTGYCAVRLTGSTETVHTQQIFTPEFAAAEAGKVDKISFELTISDELTEGAELSVIPCWGSSALPAEDKLYDGHSYTFDGSSITETAQEGVENNTTENE